MAIIYYILIFALTMLKNYKKGKTAITTTGTHTKCHKQFTTSNEPRLELSIIIQTYEFGFFDTPRFQTLALSLPFARIKISQNFNKMSHISLLLSRYLFTTQCKKTMQRDFNSLWTIEHTWFPRLRFRMFSIFFLSP